MNVKDLRFVKVCVGRRVALCTLFFYNHTFYKNIEAEICKILRIL